MTAQKSTHGSEKRKRAEQHRIRLTTSERKELNMRAEAAGMSVAAYVRHQALGAPGPRSVKRLPLDAVLVRQLIGQLGYIGNNLNQLTRAVNVGDIVEPRELAPVLREVNEAIKTNMALIGRSP